MSRYGSELVAFFRARDAKKLAKKSLKEAQAKYTKACADLEAIRDNFNAALRVRPKKMNEIYTIL